MDSSQKINEILDKLDSEDSGSGVVGLEKAKQQIEQLIVEAKIQELMKTRVESEVTPLGAQYISDRIQQLRGEV